jgi:hypothetical protein
MQRQSGATADGRGLRQLLGNTLLEQYANAASGTPVKLVNCRNNGDYLQIAQLWNTRGPLTRLAGKCIDMDGTHGAARNGTNVQLWSCHGTSHQVWDFHF